MGVAGATAGAHQRQPEAPRPGEVPREEVGAGPQMDTSLSMTSEDHVPDFWCGAQPVSQLGCSRIVVGTTSQRVPRRTLGTVGNFSTFWQKAPKVESAFSCFHSV